MPHQLVLNCLSSKTNLVFSCTLHAFQREIRRNDTFNLFLTTLFKELFTNKGEKLSCKSVRTRKNRKNSRAYYIRTRDKSGSNSPPFQRNVQIPPSPGTMHSQMPGVCPGGGCWSFELIGALDAEANCFWIFFSNVSPSFLLLSQTTKFCFRANVICTSRGPENIAMKTLLE